MHAFSTIGDLSVRCATASRHSPCCRDAFFDETSVIDRFELYDQVCATEPALQGCIFTVAPSAGSPEPASMQRSLRLVLPR